MLFTYKRFRLQVRPVDIETIEKKLDEFGIIARNKDYYTTEICGHKFDSIFIECTERCDIIDKLTAWLHDEFKGIASITY